MSEPCPEHLNKMVDELVRHTDKLRKRWETSAAQRLRRLARELSKATDAEVRESAIALESMLLSEEAEASALAEKVEALIQSCKRK
ncbi:MAG: hypothetical protein ACYS0D_04795 [Planctomycetota bacterium]|jgi:uncharacterized coiled-coil DUF342 family protein